MRIHLLVLIFSVTTPGLLHAQTDSKPKGVLKSVLKKENDKFGVIDESVKSYREWTVKPEYDRVTAIDFSNPWEPVYYKFWKGNTYDIVRHFRLKREPWFKYEVVVKNVSEIVVTDEAGMKNFFPYKSNGKWGCFAYWEDRNERYNFKAVEAVYDTPPVQTNFRGNEKYILVQSGGLSGILDNEGYMRLDVGSYKTADDKLVITHGADNLKGYTIGRAITVPSIYTNIEELPRAETFLQSYFICTLPDGKKEVRDGGKLLSQDEVTSLSRTDKRFAGVAPEFIRHRVLLDYIEADEKDNGSGTIVKVNGKAVSIAYTKQDIFYGFSEMGVAMFYNGQQKIMYFKSGNKVLECNYDLLPGDNYIKVTLPDKPWPGEDTVVPVVLVDSAKTLLVINTLNQKRMALPIKVVYGGTVAYNNQEYYLDKYSSHDNISFSRSYTITCSHCNGKGHTTEKRMQTIKGSVSYDTKEVTEYKTENEQKWNPNTNSYVWVSKQRPVRSYETIETREPDREEEVEVQINCKFCNSKGSSKNTEYIGWNGKEFTVSNP